jgi:hypothetical protein
LAADEFQMNADKKVRYLRSSAFICRNPFCFVSEPLIRAATVGEQLSNFNCYTTPGIRNSGDAAGTNACATA